MQKRHDMARADLQRVERARERLDDARAGLLVAILAARDSGESLRDIAHAAGISHQRVHQIVKSTERKAE